MFSQFFSFVLLLNISRVVQPIAPNADLVETFNYTAPPPQPLKLKNLKSNFQKTRS